MNKIPTRQLGRNGPVVSAVGLGTMGMGAWYGKTDKDAAYESLTYAADRGMTFWDTADIYGTPEQLIGEWFAKSGRRADIFLATKFGSFDPDKGPGTGSISKPSYIKKALARSLANLGTTYIDLYYQSRVDASVPIEIVLETLREYVDNGTIRWLGLSECSAETLLRARAVPGIGERVVACEVELSPFELSLEKNGFLRTADDAGVAIVAYSPLGRGLVSGAFRSRADFDKNDFRLMLPRYSEENFAKNLELADKLKLVGEKYGASPSQVAIAWILAEFGKNVIPIPGCRSAARVEENAHAAELVFSPEDVRAIRALTEAADIQGERAPPQFVYAMDSLPLEEWKDE
ncbi:hypothetical protein M0805_008249 [Coniferiporia weirii]|nr:hypothetical protein M0805_008249 [Coniferiporia weirii]